MKLAEYLATHSNKRACRICVHPKRDELDEALRKDASVTLIMRWLAGEGLPEASGGAIRNHRSNGHHIREVPARRAAKSR